MIEPITLTFTLTRKTRPNTLRGGNQMISANDRMFHHTKADITRFLRELPKTQLPYQDAPIFTHTNPCRVVVDIKPPTRRRMDAPNWYPTVKALLDGVVDQNLLSDDNNKVIVETCFKSTGLSGSKEYILTVTFEPINTSEVGECQI